MKSFSAFILLNILLLVSAKSGHPVIAASEIVSGPLCTDKVTQLGEHDCNVALLSVAGGIQGKIQVANVNGPTTTGKSGSCAVKLDVANGGKTINLSKGRLEGLIAAMRAKCGNSPSTIVGKKGSVGGDIKVTIEKSQ